MATERTLSIIKPDATRRNLTGKINAMLEDAGLRIVAQRRMQLTTAQAQAFYAVHAERPFYNDLVSFMISGPVVVQVLEGADAVANTAMSWAPPTRPTPPRAPSAKRSPKASKPIRCTGRTAPKTRPMKSRFSSLARISLAKPPAARPKTQKAGCETGFF